MPSDEQQKGEFYLLAAQPWVRSTFKSVPVNNRLLAPDYEIGLISHRDYVYTSTFLAAMQPYYYITPGTTGAAAALATYGIHYQRPMSFGRRLLLFNVLWFAANGVGISLIAAKHLKFWNTLEDPRSVAQAFNNVKLRLSPGADLGAAESFPAPSASPASQTPRPAPSPSESVPHTRWDDIRSANANKASGSAWEALRQQHERSQLPDSDSQSNSSQTKDSRAAAQAEFDAMLERERNIKN